MGLSQVEALKLGMQALSVLQPSNWVAREAKTRAWDAMTKAIAEAEKQPAQKPPNCGTGYCSCIECLFEQPAQDDRNKLANWMMQFAFATGHGDTMEDLLDALGTEIVDTVDAAREDEREQCARLCEADGLLWGRRYAAAIRARGQT